LGNAPRSDQRSKMEQVVPKMMCRRGLDAGNPGGGVSDPAEGFTGAARRILPFYPAYR